MIDLSKLTSPAWQRVVNELTAPAPSDQAFLAKLTSVLAQVASAKQAVLFAQQASAADDEAAHDPKPVYVWPPASASGSGPGLAPIAHEGDAMQAARRAAGQANALAFQTEDEGPYYEANGAQMLAAPVRLERNTGNAASVAPRYVVTLLLEPRSEQALQTTIALVEVLAGYANTHTANQALKEVQNVTGALGLAAQLISTLNTAENFKGACFQLVNDVQRVIQVDRVALGWCKGVGPKGEGERVKAVAISDTEMLDRRMHMVQKIEHAMDECLDQEQPVLYPAPPEKPEPGQEADEADVLLSQAITHAHRELASSDATMKIASLPLRVDERVVGVMTMETSGKGENADALTIDNLETVQAALDLIAPVMRIRRSDDRALPLRAVDSSVEAAGWVVGPKHTVWKLAGIALMVAALLVVFVHIPYKIEAPCEIQPRERRAVSIPFSGVIASVPEGVEPGARVEAGQLLAQLETTDLRLQRLDAQNEILRAEKRADEARAQNNLAEAQQAEAQANQARARVALIDRRVEQASLVAPLSGVIIAGDAKDFVGASVELGQMMFEVASMDDLIAVAKADDRDIKLIQEAQAAGLKGSMATKAYPAQRFEGTLERIVPLAQPDEGKNTFEVRVDLDEAAGWMRPGMEGLVKFDTGKRSLLDIGTRRIRDQLRLWLWF